MPRLFLAFVLLLLGAATLPAQTTQRTNPPAPADNTKVNQRDQSKGAVTADQQKLNSSDQQITKNIRSAVMKDKGLSTYAHNVKIITQNGKVTLKGPVRTEDEKTSIETKAKTVAGADNVINEIEIAPNTK